MQPAARDKPDDRFAAFRHRSFLRFWTARFVTTFATQIVSVAVGWQVYDLTRNPFDLGIVGLVQFLPSLLLVLVTGAAADRFGRRLIAALATTLEAACAMTLLAFAILGVGSVVPVFVVLAAFGVARAFYGPATGALVANLVPAEHFANAVAWNSSAWQTATILGPVAGGLLYGLSPAAAYGVAILLFLVAAALMLLIPKPPQHEGGEPRSLSNLLAGFRYIWSEKIVLGAISLDLFAVLLGGAVALLPVFARDILELGPWGLGMLRSAPGVGAVLTALALATRPCARSRRHDHVCRRGALRRLHRRLRSLILGVVVDPAAGARRRGRHDLGLHS